MMLPSYKLRSNPLVHAAIVLMLSMLTSVVCKAAALGDELVLSQLGDPVEVEIAVLQWEDIDLAQLQISAGTPEVYESFGLDYLPALEHLNFNLIGPNLAGEVKVLVSSREPIVEPYLQLLLVMRWPGGSLLREYVLLFDPPRTSKPAPTDSSVTPPQVPTPSEPLPAPQQVVAAEFSPPTTGAETVAEPEPVTNERLPTPEAATVREVAQEVVAVAQIPVAKPVDSDTAIEAQAATAAATSTISFQPGTTYTVQSGDTLWDIGTRHGPVGANANLYQILLGLYELNRDAFINGNISLLKYGVTLQLPTAADVAAINADTAQSVFDQRWHEGSERIDLAERGEPLPPLSSIFAPEVVRPEINPTADIPQNAGVPTATGTNDGLVIPSSDMVPTPAAGATQTTGSERGALLSVDQTGIPTLALAPAGNGTGLPVAANLAGSTAIAVTSINPYMDEVKTSAQFMQDMLDARQEQVKLIEAQMSEMSIRMLEITRVTERLNTSLEETLAERDRQQKNSRRNTLLLGGLVLILSIALIAIVTMVLKLAAQIRVQHAFLQATIQHSTKSSMEDSLHGSLHRSSSVQPLATPQGRNVTEASIQLKEPEFARTEKLQKALASEHALAVSIIEEDDLESEPDSKRDQDVNKIPAIKMSKEELNAALGDMELDHPEDREMPESR